MERRTDRCLRCGKEGVHRAMHINLGYQRYVAVFECECGARWYNQPTDVVIGDRLMKSGRWEADGFGGWRPDGLIYVEE